MAKKMCYICEKKYAIGRVLHYPLCRRCRREVKRFSKRARVYEYKTIEDKLLDGKRRFDSRKDFILGWLLCTILFIVLALTACWSYGGF